MRKWQIRKKIVIVATAIMVLFLFAIGIRTYSHIRISAPCPRCDVYVLSVDTLRADTLPCYGNKINTAPNICSFARRGTQFRNAFSQSSWTYMDQLSFFTSLYATVHGQYDPLQNALPPWIMSLPQEYRNAGYHTVFVQGQHAPYVSLRTNIRHAFDTVITLPDSKGLQDVPKWATILSDLKRKTKKPLFVYFYTSFLTYYIWDYEIVKAFPLDPEFQFDPSLTLNVFTDNAKQIAIDIIGEMISEHDVRPDVPYESIKEGLQNAKSLSAAKKIFSLLPMEDQKSILWYNINYQLNASNANQVRYMKNLYENRLHKIDIALQSFFSLLETPSFRNRSITVLVSDHGESFGEHSRFRHAKEPYDTVTHVPLIISAPRIKPAVLRNIVQMIDVFPTLLSLTGIRLPPNSTINGTDRSSDMYAGISSPGKKQLAISEIQNSNIQSIRTPDWRLIFIRDKNTTMLFKHPEDDPENHDVSSQYPGVVSNLKQMLEFELSRIPPYNP